MADLGIPDSLFQIIGPRTSGGPTSGYQAFVQGQRNAQENRKLSMEEASHAIQNESNRLAIQEHGLNIELKRKQLERDAQILAGQNEALDIMLQAGQDESGYLSPEISQRLHNLAVRNPAIFTAPAGQALIHNWQGARVASKAMTDAGVAGLKPSRITVDPVTGKEQITYGESDTALDEQRRALARKYGVQADAIEEGGGLSGVKTPADVQRAEFLTAKQKAFDEAIASGDPERIANTARELNSAKIAMHANREEDRAGKITDQAFRATHQALLTKLRNLYAQQPFAGKTQKPALDAQIKDIEEQLGSLITDYARKQTVPVSAPVIPSSRIQVKSPDGKLFTIPADQLDEAKKQGFQEVP